MGSGFVELCWVHCGINQRAPHLVSSRGKRGVIEITRTHEFCQDPYDADKDHNYGLRVDLLIPGHFYWGTGLLFNFRVPILDTKSHFRTNPDKLLAFHRRTNKMKYLKICFKKLLQFILFFLSI